LIIVFSLGSPVLARRLAAGINGLEDDFFICLLERHDKNGARDQNAQKTLIRVFLRPRMLLYSERPVFSERREDILEGYALPLLETDIFALVPGYELRSHFITLYIQCQKFDGRKKTL
jgi:hypothetical protein